MSEMHDLLGRRWTLYVAFVGGGFWLLLAASLVAFRSELPSMASLVPLLALAIAGEELVVRQRARSGTAVLSFSTVAHVATAVLLGPLAAAAVAAFAVVIVDGSRHSGRRLVLINSAMLGGSIWVGGECYRLAGGTAVLGSPRLVLPLLLLVLSRYLASTLVFTAGAALSSGRRFGGLLRDVATEDLGATVGEGSLGVLVAFALARPHHWIVVPFLIPLFVALYRSNAMLEQLKSETGNALESLAHVIDDRDPSTSEHAERVADYVARFLEFIDLGEAESDRLITAAKFHDLGKIAVDVATLTKADRLAPGEVDAIRRHPRLSAYLLDPFHFAREMTPFVELHHERYDGQGYYRVPREEIPIEAHVLIAADSFDAMTSQRPYRPALTSEQAAQELLNNAGTQFHPLVARAFAGMMLGDRVDDVLESDQLAALRRSFASARPSLLSTLSVPRDPRAWVVFSAVTVMLLLAAVGSIPASLSGGLSSILALCGCWWGATFLRTRRRERKMVDSLFAGDRPSRALECAGMTGWIAWLESNAGRTRYEAVEVDDAATAPTGALAEACRYAARRESSTEVALAAGRWLSLRNADPDTGRRLALILKHRPSSLERHLLDSLALRLTPPTDDPKAEPQAAQRRTDLPASRAVFLVDLRAFDQLSRAAGQLVAERFVNEAERRLERLLRSTDSITRIGDDKFGVAALVPDEGSLNVVRERIASLVDDIPTPHGISMIAPQIVGAFGDEITRLPELQELDDRLSPHAHPLVTAT